MEPVYLSVIIPAYNEEKRLPKTLFDVDKYLKNQSYTSEIIVVDNGSRDRTSAVVKELQSKISNLVLLEGKQNTGKGFAVKRGMLGAKGEYKLFMDADNSTSVDQVEKFLPEFKNGYDVVIGSRDAKGAVLDPPQPFYRRLLGDIFRLLTQITCGTWGILDSQCGFKCFSKKAAEDIFPKCVIDHFAFDPEVLVIAKKMGYKIKEMPVVWKNDLASKVKVSGMVKMGLDLFKIRGNIIAKKYDR